MVASTSRGSEGSSGHIKGDEGIDLEAAMKNVKLKESNLDDVFVDRMKYLSYQKRSDGL